jgi:drug/metabolite transporter (DMT)-like permease
VDSGQKDLWLGAALAFASALCYAVYLVAGGEVIARVGSVRFTAYAMSAASVACILQWFLLRPLSALALPAPVYLYAIGMAVLSTAIPVFMTSEALRRVGANTVAIVGALGPVTTIAFGYLGLEELMTPLQLVGSALVLAGVLIISLKPAGGRR